VEVVPQRVRSENYYLAKQKMQVNPYTKQASDTKHDLVFFANRSTPKVVARNENVKSKNGYGKMTKRRRATEAEEETISKGRWLRVDEDGNGPKDDGYKTTNYAQWRTRREKQAGLGSALWGLGKKFKVNPLKKDSWKANPELLKTIVPSAGLGAYTVAEYDGYAPPPFDSWINQDPGEGEFLTSLGTNLLLGSRLKNLVRKKPKLTAVQRAQMSPFDVDKYNNRSPWKPILQGAGAIASTPIISAAATGGQAIQDVGQAIENAKKVSEDASDVSLKAKNVIAPSIQRSSAHVEEASENLNDTIDTLKNTPQEIEKTLNTVIDERTKQFRDFSSKYSPYLATGGGALGGLLLSRILSPQPPGLITSQEQEEYVGRKRLYDLLGLTLGGGAGYLASNPEARNQIGEFFSNLANKA